MQLRHEGIFPLKPTSTADSHHHPARANRLLNTLEMRTRASVMQSRPFSVQLEVTTKCNLACIMCARDKYHGRGSNLPDDVLELFFAQVLPTAQDVIVSSFGEPLLYPRIGELFSRIDSASGLELGFFTNLLLLDEPMARGIMDSGVGYINASIDGASKETYEAIRKGGKWEDLLEKMRLLRRIKEEYGGTLPRLNLCVVGSTLNVHETAKFVELASEFGFDSVKYNPNMYVDDEEMDYLSLVHEQEKTVHQFRVGNQRAVELDLHTNYHRKPFQAESKLPVPRDSSVPMVRLLVNHAKRLMRHELQWRIENTAKQSGGGAKRFVFLSAVKAKDKVLDSLPLIGKVRRPVPIPHVVPNDAGPRSCGNPWTHVHIKSDGKVYPCCFSDEEMGDLRKQSFEEIWNGEKYQDLRQSLTQERPWASCRRASCNWVEGVHSSIYGGEITMENRPAQIDATAGLVLPVHIKNTSKFGWNPSAATIAHSTGSVKELLQSADEKMVARNTRDARVSLSYRLLTLQNELLDEGPHIPIPEDTHKEKTVTLELPIRPILYSGPVKLKIDLVHENVTWFGERCNSARELTTILTNAPFAAYVLPGDKAALRKVIQGRWKAGEHFELPIVLRNVGTEALGGPDAKDFIGVHWRTPKGDTLLWEGARIAITEVLQPGESRNISVPVFVPSDLPAGVVHLDVDVVRNDAFWLSVMWNRPLLAWALTIGEEAPMSTVQNTTGSTLTPAFEAFGQCVPHAGSKGIW